MTDKPYYVVVKRGWHIETTRKFRTKYEAYQFGISKERQTYLHNSYYNEVNDIYKPTVERYIVDYVFPRE